jgi:hypothetical protein
MAGTPGNCSGRRPPAGYRVRPCRVRPLSRKMSSRRPKPPGRAGDRAASRLERPGGGRLGGGRLGGGPAGRLGGGRLDDGQLGGWLWPTVAAGKPERDHWRADEAGGSPVARRRGCPCCLAAGAARPCCRPGSRRQVRRTRRGHQPAVEVAIAVAIAFEITVAIAFEETGPQIHVAETAARAHRETHAAGPLACAGAGARGPRDAAADPGLPAPASPSFLDSLILMG